jgi:SAM-dependent methyltransferase
LAHDHALLSYDFDTPLNLDWFVEFNLVLNVYADRVVNLDTTAPDRDAGSGTGLYLRLLQGNGYESTGLDISREMLRSARRNLGPSARLVQGVLEASPFRKAEFDVVVASRVLSHIERLDEAMNELARITKRGGRLILTDVSAHHNYVRTRIPNRTGDVHIETFKHDIVELLSDARRFAGWRVERMKNVRFCDLLEPPDPAEYPSIDASSCSPIFFLIAMHRE